MSKNKQVAFIGLSIIVGMMSYIIGTHSSFEDDLEALKPTPRDTLLQLSVLKTSPTDNKTEQITQFNSGENLTFEISSSLPIHLALLLSIDNQAPLPILKNARTPPGKNKSLERDSNPFIYQVPENVEELKFCIVYSDTDKNLRKKLLGIQKLWPTIEASHCTTINAV